MINWSQAWWHIRQSWSFFRNAYRCGWSLYADVTDSWLHRRYAMAYAVVQATPRAKVLSTRY